MDISSVAAILFLEFCLVFVHGFIGTLEDEIQRHIIRSFFCHAHSR